MEQQLFHFYLPLQKMEELPLLARRIHNLLYTRTSGNGAANQIHSIKHTASCPPLVYCSPSNDRLLCSALTVTWTCIVVQAMIECCIQFNCLADNAGGESASGGQNQGDE